MAIPLLIPFALFMAAVGVLAVHHSADMWMTPLLNRLARPHGNWLRKTAFAPLTLVAIALRGILQLVRSVLSHWAAAHLPPLTRWMHGLRTWANLLPVTALAVAEDTLHALSWLRHHTLPHAIHVAVAPVRALARHAEHTAVAADRFAHAAEKRLLRGIDRLGHRLEHFVLQRVHGIDRLIREHVLPRIRAAERAIAVTIPRRLLRVETRLKRLEKLLAGGLLAGLIVRTLVRRFPWLFCRNTARVGRKLCGLNRGLLDFLLGGGGAVFVFAELCRLIETVSVVAARVIPKLIGPLAVAGAALCDGKHSAAPPLPLETTALPQVSDPLPL